MNMSFRITVLTHPTLPTALGEDKLHTNTEI
jgi:hypothetical protein